MARTKLMLCALVGVVYFSSTGAQPPAAPEAAPQVEGVPGVWTEQHYSFTHLGFTSTYSCDGLADKLKRLLIIAGARADVVARPGGCSAGFGRPSKFASADLKFYTLKPADTVAPAPGSPCSSPR